MPGIDQNLVKALAHPLRVRILEALQGRVASPSELAKEMDESLGVVSYHTNMLADYGCIEEVRTRPRRGVLEHFFAVVPRSFVGHQDWRRVPRSVRGEVTAAAFESFLEATVAAAEAGTIDNREKTTLSWMQLRVDEQGWGEVQAIMERALKLLSTVHERSTGRLGAADGLPVVVGLAGFEAVPRQPAGPD